MRRQITSLLVLIAIAYCAAWGEISISKPFVGGKETSNIEVGATPQVTIRYKNTTPNAVAISSVEVHLRGDATRIENIVGFTNSAQGQLADPEKNTTNVEQLYFKLVSTLFTNTEPRRSTFIVEPDKTIDLATISFHLFQKDQNAADNLTLFTIDNNSGGCKVFDGASDVTGGVAALPSVKLVASAAPAFSGQTKVESKGLGQTNVGNTLSFNWKTEGAGAVELSRFPNGKLSCKVQRSTDPNFVGAITDLPLLPGNPPTSNVEREDYVYQDGPGTGIPGTGNDQLSDGTTYYYRISAADDTSPTPNETQNNTPIAGIPYDFTAPKEVTNLTVATDINKVTLNWINPTDADLGGVLIMKNKGKPVALKSLGGATAAGHGKLYQFGEAPFDNDPEKGTVLYVSPQAYSPTEVQQSYEDYPENGVRYYYKIFTYDRAIDGFPKEFGRNYSTGVEISAEAGLTPRPINNFIVKKGDYPGEVLLTWDNSPDTFCEGVLIRYSTDDKQRFSALRDENAGQLAGAFPLSSAPGQPDYVILTLPAGFNYYFKAFAYNVTDYNQPLDPTNKESLATHNFSIGQTAALPLLVGKEEELFTYTYNFQKGINHFAVPFPSNNIADKDGKIIDVSTWEKIIEQLNAQAGGNVVVSFGRWNEIEQKAEGIISIDYSKTGLNRYLTTKGVTPAQPVIQGSPFEINVSKPFTFTLKNIAPQPQSF